MMRDIYQAITEMILPDSLWILMFILAIVIIFFMRNSEMNKGYKMFFWYAIFVGIIIWYPFMIIFVKNHFFDGEIEYARFSVALMIFPVIGYVTTELYIKGREKSRKVALIVLIAFLLLIGKWNIGYNIRKPQNIYKMPENVVRISDKIQSDDNEKKVINVYFLMIEPVDIYNDFQPETRLYWGLCQYATNIDMTNGILEKQVVDSNEFQLISDKTQWNNFDYILCVHNKKLNTQLEAAGYKKIMTDKVCNVYRKP